jgi:hypothetical protein
MKELLSDVRLAVRQWSNRPVWIGVILRIFETLGASPELGRTFTSADYQGGLSHLVILGHRLWGGSVREGPLHRRARGLV